MYLQNKLRLLNAIYAPDRLWFDPKWIVLGVNNICNLHCKMCDVGVKYNESNFFQNLMGSRPINMPLELTKRIIDQMSRYYPGCKLGFGFTEPLIYPHLIESLNYAKEKGLYTSITTNALNLNKFAPGLMEAELNELNISLDGTEAIHNEIRGHKSSFQRAIKGIDYLLEQNTSIKICVYCVITEWNIGNLIEFVDYFSSYDLERLGLLHMNFTTPKIAQAHNQDFGDSYPATSSNVSDINLEALDLALLWNEIREIKLKKTKYPILFSPEISSKDMLTTYYHHPEVFIGKRCMDIFSNLMIKSNGDVIPAHGRCYNLTIGNIYQEDINSIWHSKTIKAFRKTVNQAGGLLPACSRCCSALG